MAVEAQRPLAKGLVSGGRRVSSGDLEIAVAQAAGGFAAIGIGPGDCIAILMRNDTPFLVASLAAQRLGAYAVPVNWHFKPDEIAYIMRDSAAKVLLAHRDLLLGLDAVIPPDVTLIAVTPPPEVISAYELDLASLSPFALAPAEWSTWIQRQPVHTDPPRPAPQSMIYTSGTTGLPKGVRRAPPTAEQAKEIDQVRTVVYGLKPGVRALMPGPLYHSAPNSFGLRAAKVAECLVLMPKFDPLEFLGLVQRYRIDTVFMVPTMFVRLLKLPEEDRARFDVSSLRFVMHAAAPCPPDVKRAMIDWWGPVIWEFYGATEAGAATIVSSAEWLAKPGTVGRPAPGCRISIQDDHGQELPAGQIGEVFTRISYLPEFTYNRQPDRLAEVVRNGFVTCGDVGYLDADGYLFLCDRKRDMVISGGVNIYPAEIEGALVAIPGVRDCAVFGIPHPEFGEQLMAVVEPEPGMALEAEVISRHLRERLADYKVPQLIELRHGLPREDSGKIFKRRLRDPYWQAAGRKI